MAVAALPERLELTVHLAEAPSYRSLDIQGRIYPHWVISHVQEGQVETGTAGLRFAVPMGSVMVHPPNLPFDERAVNPGTHQYFVCDLSVGQSLELFRLYPVAPVVLLPDPIAYASAFGELMRHRAAPPSPANGLKCFALTVFLVSEILAGWEAMGSPPRPDALLTGPDRFAQVIAYMQGHLAEKLTRDDLARRAYLHPGSFDRAFGAAFAVSPMRMLRDLRLRRARELLERTDDTLDSIADACGLGDGAHFSRVFRTSVGVAPGRYRERAKQTMEGYIPP